MVVANSTKSDLVMFCVINKKFSRKIKIGYILLLHEQLDWQSIWAKHSGQISSNCLFDIRPLDSLRLGYGTSLSNL